MKTDLERRTWTAPVEFRQEGDVLVARGYAYVFDSDSQDLGGFIERVAPGAGAQSIHDHDIVALANHDPNLLLGRKSAGTLSIAEDQRGGAYEITLPDTTVGRDWAELLRRRDVIGSSFGFRVMDDEWTQDPDGRLVRTLKRFSIRDVGPVTFPPYLGTEAALRSHEAIAASTTLPAAELRRRAVALASAGLRAH